jgi:hypothetical protein
MTNNLTYTTNKQFIDLLQLILPDISLDKDTFDYSTDMYTYSIIQPEFILDLLSGPEPKILNRINQKPIRTLNREISMIDTVNRQITYRENDSTDSIVSITNMTIAQSFLREITESRRLIEDMEGVVKKLIELIIENYKLN